MLKKKTPTECSEGVNDTCSKRRSLFLVELEGVEPSSKQVTERFSTCLACGWFSSRHRTRAPQADLSPKIFTSSAGRCRWLSHSLEHLRVAYRWAGSAGDVLSPPSWWGLSRSTVLQPMQQERNRNRQLNFLHPFSRLLMREPACLPTHNLAVKTKQPHDEYAHKKSPL